MRITMRTIFEQLKHDLGRLTEDTARVNASISSGKIYRRPSDEPVALTHALGLRTELRFTDQYHRNIVYGQGWVRSTEAALQQAHDRLLRAKTLGLQGANDSQNADSRRAIAKEVKTILEDLVSLGNTKLGGRYLFGGAKTTGYGPNEAPFVLEEDGTVRYLGDRGDVRLHVADGMVQKINLDGETAFVRSGAFEALDSLRDALNADSQSDIEVAVERIDQALDYLNSQLSEIGAFSASLDSKADIQDSLKLSTTNRLSDVEDTDILDAVTQLRTLETSYQAALAAASRVMDLSLANYI